MKRLLIILMIVCFAQLVQGQTVQFSAGEELNVGDIVSMNSGGQVVKATTSSNNVIGVVRANAPSGSAVDIQVGGIVSNSGWLFTVLGAPVYLYSTGGPTNTIVSRVVIGTVVSATSFLFKPFNRAELVTSTISYGKVAFSASVCSTRVYVLGATYKDIVTASLQGKRLADSTTVLTRFLVRADTIMFWSNHDAMATTDTVNFIRISVP